MNPSDEYILNQPDPYRSISLNLDGDYRNVISQSYVKISQSYTEKKLLIYPKFTSFRIEVKNRSFLMP